MKLITIKIKDMLFDFFTTDLRLVLAWAGSAFAILVQKIGLDLESYELWVRITMDILTYILLIVTILYTIKKWRRMNKQDKKERKK